MSRNCVCHFLWGPRTNTNDRNAIVQAFQTRTDLKIQVVLYTRTGSPFDCELTITPIRNDKSQVVLFLCNYRKLGTQLGTPTGENQSKLFQSPPNSLYTFFAQSKVWMDDENVHLNTGSQTCEGSGKQQRMQPTSSPKSNNGDVHGIEIPEKQPLNNKLDVSVFLHIPNQSYQYSSLSLTNNLLSPVNSNSRDFRVLKSLSIDNASCDPSLRIPTRTTHRPQPWRPRTSCTTNQTNAKTRERTTKLQTQEHMCTSVQSMGNNQDISYSCVKDTTPLCKSTGLLARSAINEKWDFRNSFDAQSKYDSDASVPISGGPYCSCNLEGFDETFKDYNQSVKSQSTHASCLVYPTDLGSVLETSADECKDKIQSNSQKSSEINSPNHFVPKPFHHSSSILQTDYPSSDMEQENVRNPITHKRIGTADCHETKHWSFNCFECLNESRISSAKCSSTHIDSFPDPQTYSYKRRKSFAILHGLSGTKKKDNNAGKFNRQIKNLSGKSVPEYKIQKLTKSNAVLLHYGLFRIIWDWLLLFLTFYIAFMVPYNVAFGSQNLGRYRSKVLDFIIEIFLMIDIVLNFHTTYVSKSGQIVNDKQQIAKHYIQSWFILDVLAALPMDFILYLIETTSSKTFPNVLVIEQELQTNSSQVHGEFAHVSNRTEIKFNVISLLQMMKLARLLRLARLIQKITRLSQYSVVVLGILMFSFALVAHWFACIWYLIGLHERNSHEIGWLEELGKRLKTPYDGNRSSGPTEISKYFTALYFTCSSLTSVGFGNVSANTTPEKIFAIFIMLLGALMHAAVFGNVTAIIQRIYARRTAFQSKVQDLKEFVEVHRVPKPLKHRMEDFFQTMWAINRGIDVKEVLKIYPEELQRDIYLHLNRELLGLKIFEKASQDCLKNLALHIKLTFCTPGEYLIHTGDVLRRLYFVSNGSLEVLENDEVVALLGKNDWFGAFIDSPLMSTHRIKSRCDVKSLTYCDLHSIDLMDMTKILEAYPLFKEEFKAYLYEDLSFDIQEGAEKFQSSDIITIPAITLQLANDEKEWELNDKKSPDRMDNPIRRSSKFECSSDYHRSMKPLDDLETGTINKCHSQPFFLNGSDRSSNNGQDEFMESGSSMSDDMRYYPRRPRSTNPNGLSKRKLKCSGLFGSPDRKHHLLNKIRKTKKFVIIRKNLTRNNLVETSMLQSRRLSVPCSSRRHTLPVVQNQEPMEIPNRISDQTDDTWVYSNCSSSSHLFDDACPTYSPTTQMKHENLLDVLTSHISNKWDDVKSFSFGAIPNPNMATMSHANISLGLIGSSHDKTVIEGHCPRVHEPTLIQTRGNHHSTNSLINESNIRSQSTPPHNMTHTTQILMNSLHRLDQRMSRLESQLSTLLQLIKKF